MINYYYPTSFLYKENIYLFLDIFIKNDELILIVPIYENFILDENKLIINNNNIKLKEKLKYIEYEGIIILKYLINLEENELDSNNININIKYETKTQNFNLNIDNFRNIYYDNLSISTLFKNDYYLLDCWIDFYSKKNISDFYLYYNGKIDNISDTINNIKNKYQFLNITFIEWDYHYWNNSSKFKHHAQTGMLNHCLYYFCKNYYYYWLNIDLDEYINNINFEDNCDLYIYHNRWARLENSKITNYNLDLYKTTFYLGKIQQMFRIKNYNNFNNFNNFNIFIKKLKNNIYILTNRTKWIINTTKFDAVSIHIPKLDFNKEYIINNEYWFAHFSSWSKSNIRKHYFEDNYILDNHFDY